MAALEQKLGLPTSTKIFLSRTSSLAPRKWSGSPSQVVQYRLQDQKIGDLAEVSVWIDTKTQLPLKRMMAGAYKKTIGELTETYSVFTCNSSKLDGKLFDIPPKRRRR